MLVSGSSVSAGAGDLEAEWESFEKLISGGSDGAASESTLTPSAVPCPSAAVFPTSFSPPLANNTGLAVEDVYGRSLCFPQNLYSCGYGAEKAVMLPVVTARKSSTSAHDSDSDMDICSDSSNQEKWTKRSPPSRRPTTSSVSSSAILAANAAANSDLESGSESGKSGRSLNKEMNRERFSESEESVEENQLEKRVHRSSSSSHSDSQTDEEDHAENSALMREHSPSTESDKSASPKLASPDVSAKKVAASDSSETVTKNVAEPKEASQDRLRSKLLALAEEKVRSSRSRSCERSKRHGRHSPSRRHMGFLLLCYLIHL